MNAMPVNRTAAQIAIEGVRKTRMASPVRERDYEIDAPVDRGAEGEAAKARPRSIEQVATGNKRQGREKAEAVRYQDSDLWWHYRRSNVLTERQFEAGIKLTRLYQAGYSAMLALPSYGNRTSSGLGPVTGVNSDEDKARSLARRQYNQFADAIPHSARHAMSCLVRGEKPKMMMRAQNLRDGCDAVADAMGLPREGG